MTQTDDELLDAIAELYADLDPAPADLADGVLARLAVEDLETEYELLTLVERVDHAARHPRRPDVDRPRTTRRSRSSSPVRRTACWCGSAQRRRRRRRLDGWVVPARPMRVFLGPQGDALAHTRQSAYADRDGRFEFPSPMSGEVRLWLLPQAADESGRAASRRSSRRRSCSEGAGSAGNSPAAMYQDPAAPLLSVRGRVADSGEQQVRTHTKGRATVRPAAEHRGDAPGPAPWPVLISASPVAEARPCRGPRGSPRMGP